METLIKKIKQIEEFLKAFKASIKQQKINTPGAPRAPKTMQIPKIPGLPSASKKDPVKVAEQIATPDNKDNVLDAAKQIKETLKISKSGQWELEKVAIKTPTFLNNHNGLIPKDHADYQGAINHINNLHREGFVNEARRVNDRYITGGQYVKGIVKTEE